MLHQLKNAAGAIKKARRVGRGPGSTFGKTSARGQKGQKARNTVARGFEGGQTPLHRRLPRRGFTNIFKETFSLVNLEELTERKKLADKDTVGLEELLDANAIRNTRQRVKILGNGEISRAVTVKAHKFSRSAEEKIKAAGGKVVTL